MCVYVRREKIDNGFLLTKSLAFIGLIISNQIGSFIKVQIIFFRIFQNGRKNA